MRTDRCVASGLRYPEQKVYGVSEHSGKNVARKRTRVVSISCEDIAPTPIHDDETLRQEVGNDLWMKMKYLIGCAIGADTSTSWLHDTAA